ncbi:hypothetical protein U1Q18_035186 [Sarracenia purpurea var. burkii]
MANIFVPFPIKIQFPGVDFCVNSSPSWPVAILLGFQHYVLMLGTSVIIPSIIVPLMGGGNREKAEVIQTLLFVAGLNTLLQTWFGTRLPVVIGGSYTFVFPAIFIVLADRYSIYTDPIDRFKMSMRGIQGAILVASILPILVGFLGLWRIFVRGAVKEHGRGFSINDEPPIFLARFFHASQLIIVNHHCSYSRRVFGSKINGKISRRVKTENGSGEICIRSGFNGSKREEYDLGSTGVKRDCEMGPRETTGLCSAMIQPYRGVKWECEKPPDSVRGFSDDGGERVCAAITVLHLLAQCVEIGLPELVILIIFSQYIPHWIKSKGGMLERFFERYAVLLSIAIVWPYAAFLTVAGAYKNRPPNTQFSCRVDRSGLITDAPWIRVPLPWQWGTPTVNIGEAFVMMAAAFVALIESTGTFIAASRYGSATPPLPSVLSRGAGWLLQNKVYNRFLYLHGSLSATILQ